MNVSGSDPEAQVSGLSTSRLGIASFCSLGVGCVLLVGLVASGMNADLRYLKLAALLVFVPGPLAVLLASAGLIWDENKRAALFALPSSALATIVLLLMGG